MAPTVAYCRTELLDIGASVLGRPIILNNITPINYQIRRGCRAGWNKQRIIPAWINLTRAVSIGGRSGICRKNLVHVNVNPATTCGQIKACLLNARSVNKKEDLIVRLVDDYDADIRAITETWLKPRKAAQIRALTPMGYKFDQVPRPGTEHGGGVGIICRQSFILEQLPAHKIQSFEYMCFQLKSRTAHFLICIVYRPPSTSPSLFCEEFSDLLLRHRLTSCDTVIIMGDFNFKVDLMDGVASEFQSMVNFHRLQQHVSGSTHEDGPHAGPRDLTC